MSESLSSFLSRLDVRLKAGLSEEEVNSVTASWPGGAPFEICELLHFASGFDVHGMSVDFTGRACRFSMRDLVPNGIALTSTRDGDFWVVDVQENGRWHQVFYLSHDPPVLVVQFASLREFILELADDPRTEKRAAALAAQIFKSKPSRQRAGELGTSSDVILRRFALSLSAGFEIIDLREAPLPAGFAWGSAGATAGCRRAGLSLLFAVQER